jgi:hypothetical protein
MSLALQNKVVEGWNCMNLVVDYSFADTEVHLIGDVEGLEGHCQHKAVHMVAVARKVADWAAAGHMEVAGHTVVVGHMGVVDNSADKAAVAMDYMADNSNHLDMIVQAGYMP